VTAPSQPESLCGSCQATSALPLCSDCLTKLRTELLSGMWLPTELEVTFIRMRRFVSQSDGARSSATPVPFDDRVGTMPETLFGTLRYWARFISPHVPHLDRIEKVPPLDTRALAAWLWRNAAEYQRTDPQTAGAAFRAILGVLDDAKAIVDRPPDTVTYGLCDAPRPDGTKCPAYLYGAPPADMDKGIIRCTRCRSEHDVAKRRTWMLDYVAQMSGTISEVSTYLTLAGVKVSPDAIRSMLRRNRIRDRGFTAEGDRLVRFSDVIAAQADKYSRNPAPRSATFPERSGARLTKVTGTVAVV
jgi:hypothetical protein